MCKCSLRYWASKHVHYYSSDLGCNFRIKENEVYFPEQKGKTELLSFGITDCIGEGNLKIAKNTSTSILQTLPVQDSYWHC